MRLASHSDSRAAQAGPTAYVLKGQATIRCRPWRHLFRPQLRVVQSDGIVLNTADDVSPEGTSLSDMLKPFCNVQVTGHQRRSAMSRRSTAQKAKNDVQPPAARAADEGGSRAARLKAMMNLLGTCSSNTVDADLRAMLNRQMSFHRNLLLDQVDHTQYANGAYAPVKGTLLHWSVSTSTLPVTGQKAVIQWLLDEGLFIDDTDSDGLTPLQRVVQTHAGNTRGGVVSPAVIETAAFFVERGADLDVEHPTTRLTVLETVITSCPSHVIASTQPLIKALKEAQVKYRGNIKQEGPAPKRRRTTPLVTPSSAAAAATEEAEGRVGDISQLYLTGMYTDVTLVVGRQKLKAHKQVLAERSEYFKVMLGDGKRWKESRQSEIKIEEVDAGVLHALLKCLYKNKLEPLADVDPFALLQTALQFQVSMDIRDLVEGLEDALEPKNVVDVLKRAKVANVEQVVTVCRRYIRAHHCDIVQMHGAVFDEEEKEELWSALKQGGKYRLPRV